MCGTECLCAHKAATGHCNETQDPTLIIHSTSISCFTAHSDICFKFCITLSVHTTVRYTVTLFHNKSVVLSNKLLIFMVLFLHLNLLKHGTNRLKIVPMRFCVFGDQYWCSGPNLLIKREGDRLCTHVGVRLTHGKSATTTRHAQR